MVKTIDCPREKIIGLVALTDRETYESTIRCNEDHSEKYYATLKQMSPGANDKELMPLASALNEIDRQRHIELLKQIKNLGNTRTEAIQVLGYHVENCRDCRRTYFKMLEDEAIIYKRLNRELYRKIGTPIRHVDIEAEVKRIDQKHYLGLTNFRRRK